MAWYNWSQTANSNATADSSINWAEGMPPSAVNDSARAMMAATAKYRDDIAGAIVTTGTSTAYAVASYSVYDTFAHLNGQMIAFTPHTTNGATVTINVDSLGAKPLRSSPSVELLAGTLIQGTPYVATYSNADGAFYLQSFFGNPYNVPLGAGMDFWGTTAPNSSFAFPTGQQISQTTYATLYALFGSNRYGSDAGGNFFLPDKTGRVSLMKESVGTRITSAVSGIDGGTMGSAGGAQSHILSSTEMPSHTHSNFLTDNGHSHGVPFSNNFAGGGSAGASATGSPGTTTTTVGTGITITNASAGGGAAHTITQPGIVCNYIIRII